MGREASQGLDLAEVVNLQSLIKFKVERVAYLFNRVKMVLHALNGNVLARLDALSFEHFREGSFTFLTNQPVLCTLLGPRHVAYYALN